jgi:ERCC4-related helicase
LIVAEHFEGLEPMTPGSFDPFSSEMRLRSFYSILKEHRNLIAHGRKGDERFTDDLQAIEVLLQRLEFAFDLIEAQENDPKLEAVTVRLKQIPKDGGRIVLTTNSRATGQYLAASLRPMFENVHVVSSAVAAAERDWAIQNFRSNGGILITSVAMLEGIDLGDADILVPYDLPSNVERARMLLGRFLRLGRSNELTILIPVDDQGATSGPHPEIIRFQEALSTL